MYNFSENTIIKIVKEHNEKINSLDINHENTLLASCSNDKLIKIWLIENYTVIRTLNKHKKPVNLIKVN